MEEGSHLQLFSVKQSSHVWVPIYECFDQFRCTTPKQSKQVVLQESNRMDIFFRITFKLKHVSSLLCRCVSAFTILCLFAIKLAQACRARPPRKITQTPSLKKCTSLNYIHLWAWLSAQNRHLSHPSKRIGHKPHDEALWKEPFGHILTLGGKKQDKRSIGLLLLLLLCLW